LQDGPDDFVRDIGGTLNTFNEDREEFDVPVGRVTAYRVEAALARQAGEPIEFVFDSVDDELADYYSNLFDGDDFAEDIQRLMEPGFGSDLLIVDRVEIDPKFRGQNLGLILAIKTIETFSEGCAYVALRPCPLQHGPYRGWTKNKLKSKGYDSFEQNKTRARAKLRKF
jgi:hypothetical protein